jgi:hypothetical protein
MSPKLFTFALLLFLTVGAHSQTVETSPSADPAKTQKEYIDFLRETMADIGNLRTLENRISFSAELASLMWYYDEREARAMYATTIGDFKELVGRYDLQMRSTVSAGDGDTDYYSGMLSDMPERARIVRKFGMAMMVRQQIAMSMAEHDADLAFSFYNDSGQVVSNPELRKIIEQGDPYFEFQLASQVAQTNPGKAADFGSKSLKNGVTYQQVDLLKDIYKKDPAKGAEFAQNMLSAVKTEKIKGSDHYVLGAILLTGTENYDLIRKNGGTNAMFSEQDLRDISERLAQQMLASDSSYDALTYANSIERFAPARAMQIRAKFRSAPNSNTATYPRANSAMADAANTMAAAANGSGQSIDANVAGKQWQEEQFKSEKQLADDIQNLGKKELPKEERQKIIDQARAIIARTPGRNKKIAALSMLSAGVAHAGDKDLSASIMKDAQSLVNPDPKNAQDFLLTWMLASGYAESDPDKAFSLLDETISRLNDTIAAFVKVGEFIDTADEMVQDGEVQVGAFGGSMIRGMTKDLGIADGTIRSLSKADFGKTKRLTNRFERPEVRILAKMLVLRAVLKPSGQTGTEPAKVVTDNSFDY